MERFGSAPHTRSFRGASVRTILLFVIAAFSAALLWATLFAQPTEAQGASAEWNGSALTYNGRQYIESGEAKRGEFPGISEGAPVFISSPPVRGAQNNTPRDIFIIYLGSGVSPPSATSAQHVKFSYDPSTKKYSNPSEQHTLSISGSYGEGATTCAVEGVGWIVCQVSTFLATGMDWIFEQITGFMEVQPLSSNTDSGLYVAWGIMRNFANAAFIIAFVIIIYAQLTSAFAGTYGIKKLLPRLIVAAILVNTSYIICALAVDISNILGNSLQGAFIDIRNQVFQVDNETWNAEYMLSWESVTGFFLSGGTAGLALGIGAFSAVGYGPGAIMLLLPVLMGLVVAILVVLLILAARQAIITILIVIAPLAFVAYLLPNTDSWFGKWRSLFMTMLIFFPAFSVVFGGSQLAGAIIIQNANSINVVILGMIVQVAPLVITPLLLKLSGSLLGRIAGMVNDSNRGLMDRTRKFANSRAEERRDRYHGNLDRKGRPRDGNISQARRLSKWAASHGRKFDQRAANSKAAADNAWHSSSAYQRQHTNAAAIDADKETIDARNAAHVEAQRITPNSQLYNRTRTMETEKQAAEAAKAKTKVMIDELKADSSSDLHLNTLRVETAKAQSAEAEAATARMMEEYKSGKLPLTGEKGQLAAELKEASIQTFAEAQGKMSAQYEVQRAISTAMTAESLAGDSLRKIAASVGGAVGETRARAQAISTLNKLDDDVLKGNIDLIKATAAQDGVTFKNLSADIVTAAINGQTSVNGRTIDSDQLKAALQLQAQEKNMSLFEQARGSRSIDQSLVSEIISMNIGDFKSAGGFHLQNEPGLNINNYATDAEFSQAMANARLSTLGSVSPENIAGLKAGWIERMADPAILGESIRAARATNNTKAITDAYMSVKKALNNEDVLAKLDNRESFVRDIERMLAEDLQKPTTDNPWN